MAGYRQFHTRFWKDGYIQKLNPRAKLLYAYFFTNENSTLHGLYELTLYTIEVETGLPLDFIESTLRMFEEDKKIIMRDDLVWVVNMRKHQTSTGSKVIRYRKLELDKISDCPLKDAYLRFIETGEFPEDTRLILSRYPISGINELQKTPNTIPLKENKRKEKGITQNNRGGVKIEGGHTNDIQGSTEIDEFPEHPLSKAFVKAFSILPHDLKKWLESCQELARIGITEEEIGITKLLMDERKLSYSGPWSIIKTAVYVHAQHIKRGPIFTQKPMEPDEIKTLARDLINFQKGQKADGHNLSQGST